MIYFESENVLDMVVRVLLQANIKSCEKNSCDRVLPSCFLCATVLFPCACLQPLLSFAFTPWFLFTTSTLKFHTDVYRYYIVYTLCIATGTKTIAASSTIGGYKVVNYSFYVHVPLMV